MREELELNTGRGAIPHSRSGVIGMWKDREASSAVAVNFSVAHDPTLQRYNVLVARGGSVVQNGVVCPIDIERRDR